MTSYDLPKEEQEDRRAQLRLAIEEIRKILRGRLNPKEWNDLYIRISLQGSTDSILANVQDVATVEELVEIRKNVEEALKRREEKKSKQISAKEAVAETQADQVVKNTKSLAQMMSEGVPEIRWVVENLIPEGGLTILASPPGSYKSYISQDLALSVAGGALFLAQFHVMEGNVLYIDEENGQVLLAKRFDQLKQGNGIKTWPKNIYLTIFQGIKLDVDEGKTILLRLVEEYHPVLVILDSMVRLMEGEEDKARDVRVVFDNLKNVMKEQKAAFVILHHLRKDSKKHGGEMADLRGSSDFPAMCDVILLLAPIGKASIRITMVKNRYIPLTEVQPFQVNVSNPGGFEASIKFDYQGLLEKSKNKAERCMDQMIEWLQKGGIRDFRQKDAIEAMRRHAFSYHNVTDSLDLLLDEGVIRRNGRGQYSVNESYYRVDEEVVL